METQTVLVPDRTEPYTLQEVFDIAWQKAVVEQKPPCIGDNYGCRYRSPEGANACLIGWTLPDSLYQKTKGSHDAWSTTETSEYLIEGKTASCLVSGNTPFPGMDAVQALYRNIDRYVLGDLQSVHDEAADRKDYSKEVRYRLVHFAKDNHLTLPEGVSEEEAESEE